MRSRDRSVDKRRLPPEQIDNLAEADQIWENYLYYDTINYLITTKNNFYARYYREGFEEFVSEFSDTDSFKRFYFRLIETFGDVIRIEDVVSDELLEKLNNVRVELRKDMQVRIRKIVKQVKFHNREPLLKTAKQISKGGNDIQYYFKQPLTNNYKQFTCESFQMIFTDGEKLNGLYIRLPTGGNRNSVD